MNKALAFEMIDWILVNVVAPFVLPVLFAVSVRSVLNGILEKEYKLIEDKEYVPYINSKRCFGRVLVQKIN
jgi:hypothetical protein